MNTNLAFTSREDLNEQERMLAAQAALPHVHVGVNTVVRATLNRPERERRALRWLGAYISRERLAPEDVCGQLETDLPVVRAALTNGSADVRQLLPKIESMRSIVEANLRAPAQTGFFYAAQEAFDFAQEEHALVEFVDITRTGKTTIADWIHLQHLDRAIYVNCPHDNSYASFIIGLARACGIGIGSGKHGKKLHIFERQIRAMFGRGLFDLLIIDEGHRLWPENLALNPKRVEFLRSLWDEKKRQVAIVILSTPQALLSSNQAQKATKRWAPGQWEGRIVRFYPPELVSDADIKKVVRWHCPDGNADTVEVLVEFAKSSPGFYGAMENVLRRARFRAKRAGEQLDARHVVKAVTEAARNTALEQKLATKESKS